MTIITKGMGVVLKQFKRKKLTPPPHTLLSYGIKNNLKSLKYFFIRYTTLM